MSDVISFRPYTPANEAVLLALNEEALEYTSPLDHHRLTELIAQGCDITVVLCEEDVAGIVMAFTDGSEYNSENYRWFTNRLKNFLYIDRIIISSVCRGRGVGNRFYDYLKMQVRQKQLHWLAAEINSVPANDVSLQFHRKQGFIEIGQQSIGKKIVSLQACAIA